MSRRQLNLAAPELLSAAKFAVRKLNNDGNPPPEVIKRLQSAIDAAEGTSDWQLAFHVTHKTWSWLLKMLKDTNDGSRSHRRLSGLVRGGSRKTARRVYCSFDVDIAAVKRFREILSTYNPKTLKATSRAFDRLIDQIDETVLNKSALEVLAEAGL